MGSHPLRTAVAVVAAITTSALSLAGAGVASAAATSNGSPPAATTAAGQVNIVDKDATAATKSLFSYLNTTRGKQVLFGAQHTTDNGITFTSTGPTETRSDVLGAVGDYPAIFGFDTLILEGGEGPGVAGKSLMENVAPFRTDIQTAHRLGGIPEISAHMENFATGKNFTDPTGQTVSHILPGGDKNAAFNSYLDAIASVANTSTDAEGQAIPMIFRP
ncbi:MAG: glycosyl hydrolase, partial [Terracoccus sp.]